LASLNAEGRTIIMVTHENDVAQHTARTIMLRDGQVQYDERR
jgi:putative ABC transport system ATP-binding protein